MRLGLQVADDSRGAACLAIHRSRWLIDRFRLVRPESVADALAHRQALGPSSAYMAGGLDLINSLKGGRRLDHLIYLASIPGLAEIVETPAALVIGCLVTHRAFEQSTVVARHFPDLAQIWSAVANVRVREKGTLAGNLMAGNSGYDVAPLLGVLEAELLLNEIADATAVLPLEGLRGASNAGGRILRAIRLPVRPARRVRYNRDLRPTLTLALAVDVLGSRICGGRVGVGCAHERPVLLPLAMVSPVERRDLPSVAADLAEATLKDMPLPRTDHVASSKYRRRVAGVLLRRELAAFGSADHD